MVSIKDQKLIYHLTSLRIMYRFTGLPRIRLMGGFR